MSDHSNTSATTPEQQDAPRSPFAGCLILIVIAVVISVLIASAGYSLKKQTEAYRDFTDIIAKPAPIEDTEGKEAEINSLIQRLRHFDGEMANQRAAQINFTTNDLNLAFAHFEVFKGFRGQLYFNKITPKSIEGIIHYPFRSTEDLPEFVRGPLGIEVRENNLNGQFIASPLLTDGKLILNMDSMTPSKGTIPDELLQQISRFLISGQLEQELEKTQKEPELLSKLRKITSLTLGDNQLILGYSSDIEPPTVKLEADEMATKAKHLVALGAVILILSMILLFILLSRRKKRLQKLHAS